LRLLALAMAPCLVAASFGLDLSRGTAQPRSDSIHQRHLRVDGPEGESVRVLLSIPRRPDRAMNPPGERYPLVVALHGRTEAAQGPVRGYVAWNRDYLLGRAYAALDRGYVTTSDYRSFVRADHLAYVNAELRQRPFGGVAVLTPYTPDFVDAPEAVRERYMAWLAGPLLAQARAEYPGVAQTRAGTGIDGVSMGGALALETGFRFKASFAAVGGIQPAIGGREGELGRLAVPADPSERQDIRLLTSDEDPFLGPTRALSEELRRRRVGHRLLVVPGPHALSFNRGPGAMELLRFHHDALAREPMDDAS